MNNEEKRKHARKKISFTVNVTGIIRGNEVLPKPTGQLFAGTEVSAGGMGLETVAEVKMNDLLALQFTLPGEKKALTLSGRVVNLAVIKSSKIAGKLRLGIRFEGLSRVDQTYLANYIGTTFLIY